MNEQTKQDILAWAQTQVNSWPVHEEDWWGSYNDEWDINIYDSDVFGDATKDLQVLVVTAYPMFRDSAGYLATDMTECVRVGVIVKEMTA